jgi:hypothetical protein
MAKISFSVKKPFPKKPFIALQILYVCKNHQFPQGFLISILESIYRPANFLLFVYLRRIDFLMQSMFIFNFWPFQDMSTDILPIGIDLLKVISNLSDLRDS